MYHCMLANDYYFFITLAICKLYSNTKKGPTVEGHVDPGITNLMHLAITLGTCTYTKNHKKMKNSPQTP